MFNAEGLLLVILYFFKVNSSNWYDTLKNIFNPNLPLKFPVFGKNKLTFQIHWFYRWLAYSEAYNSAFYKYFMWFCPQKGNTQKSSTCF